MSLLVEMPLVISNLEQITFLPEERALTPPGLSLWDEYGIDLKDSDTRRSEPIIPQIALQRKKANQSSKSKATTVVAFDHGKVSGGDFAKVSAKVLAEAPASAIAGMFAGRQVTGKNPALADVPAGTPISVRIFLACDDTQRPPLNITLSEEASVDQTIKVALAQYVLEKRSPDLPQNSLFYQLRLTDDDEGTPDEDLPALERSQILKKVGCMDFALCRNPKGEAEFAEKPAPLGVDLTPSDDASSSGPKIDEDGNIFLKVHLPSGGSSKVKVSADILVKDLLKIISTRRSLPVNSLTVVLKDAPIAVDLSATLRSLGTDEILLQRGRRDSSPASPLPVFESFGKRPRSNSTLSVGSGPDVDMNFMFSDFSAIKYQEWTVTKINRSNKRQVRVLGIDDERIHNNMSADNENTGKLKFLKKGIKAVKKKYRQLDEVTGVINTKGSPEFRIEYKEGFASYEAATPNDAAEICAKINFLLNMRTRSDK